MIDGERYRSIFVNAMAATGSRNRGERWDCFREDQVCHVFVWGEESLDCHTYFGAVHLTQEAPAGFESTEIGRLLGEGEVTTMFVENAPLCGLTENEYRRVALAAADVLTPEAMVIFDWINGRIAPLTARTPALLRGPDPHEAFDDGVVIGPHKRGRG